MNDSMDASGLDIAVIGMAGRFPGASDVDTFWQNLVQGVESIVTYSDDALRALGVPDDLLADPDYVKAGVPFEGVDRFDADFFGYTPRDAEQTDPQHRIFLECAWHALEHAGYDPHAYAGAIGVYAGAGASVYLMRHLLQGDALSANAGIAHLLGLMSGNLPDTLATRVAYKLNLRGPAVTLQTACSTSLMAVHAASQALLGQECDMALAGGVSLNLLQNGGYRYQAGAIFSRDGHCRAFDADASGTLQGSGAALVVLKRLDDALRDGDTIHAVIKGSAANNDGSEKVGFTAPSINGQAAVIRAAQDLAGVTADSIGYIEAHGTGTTLGDPIEVAALTQAFRETTERTGYCAIGSVKTNIGHLDAAAGVTGLIKAVLALKHKTLPPSLHYQTPNPQIDFDNSPFYVNTVATPWDASTAARRAGVSSFGIGGTNVHVVLEEAPAPVPLGPPGAAASQRGVANLHWLPVSALSATALTSAVDNLADAMAMDGDASLEDIAFTLRAGRRHMQHRAVALARTLPQAAEALTRRDPTAYVEGKVLSERPSVAFLFPGQGAQHVGMSKALYDSEPSYRDTVDRCSELLRHPLALDLRDVLFPTPDQATAAARQLGQTAVTQPALFVVEYAMAKWWMQQGIHPDAMLGHSIGEYAAACLAGVFTLEDALSVVAARGRLIQSMAPGAMLAISLPESDLRSHRYGGCDLAAVNAADLCVLSGPVDCIERAEQDILSRGIGARRLHVSHGFHSAMVEPMLARFEALLATVKLSVPKIPFISNVTGRWITAEQATSPAYWANHVRCTVRFADGLGELLGKKDRVLLEVGPGDSLTSLARRHASADGRPVMASQCHPQRAASNGDQPMRCFAQLWVAGVDVPMMRAQGAGRRVPLPGYPFERKSYWVEALSDWRSSSQPHRNECMAVYAPVWQRVPLAASRRTEIAQYQEHVLLIGDEHTLIDAVAAEFQKIGWSIVRVIRGNSFGRLSSDLYTVRPDSFDDYRKVRQALDGPSSPSVVCDLWNVGLAVDMLSGSDAFAVRFARMLALAKALGQVDGSISLNFVATELFDVIGVESIDPEKAAILGAMKVVSQEYAHIACRLIDVESMNESRSARFIVEEIVAKEVITPVAYRTTHRWTRAFAPVQVPVPPLQRFRERGVYLITGGMGGVGLQLAGFLARNWRARLALLSRTAPDSQQSQAIADLESMGAEVLALQADVANEVELVESLERIRNHFGAISGIVHAAGVLDSCLIADLVETTTESVFRAKVQGTRLLLSAVQRDSPDFVVLCSSLASSAGGLGKVAYAAANAYLDATAIVAQQKGSFVVSIGWDGWRNTGMAARTLSTGQLGISPDDGVTAFQDIVNGYPYANVVVSAEDLNKRLSINSEDMLTLLPPISSSRDSLRKYPRPKLSSEFVLPKDDLESALAAIWSDVLGTAPIGTTDNFFELGGDSLSAIQMLARVRVDYGIGVHPGEFFREPTIMRTAMLVEIKLIDEIESQSTPKTTSANDRSDPNV